MNIQTQSPMFGAVDFLNFYNVLQVLKIIKETLACEKRPLSNAYYGSKKYEKM